MSEINAAILERLEKVEYGFIWSTTVLREHY